MNVTDKKQAHIKNTALAKAHNKYERGVKSGYTKDASGMTLFPNLFTAKKVFAKISAAQEEEGKAMFLKDDTKRLKKQAELLVDNADIGIDEEELNPTVWRTQNIF